MDRIERIRQTLDKADKLEGDAEALKWKAAEDIWEELQAGTSTRDLAKQVGKSHDYLSRSARAWQRFGVMEPLQRPTFPEAMERILISPQAAEAAEKYAEEAGVTFSTAARQLRGGFVKDAPATVEQVKKAMKDPDVAFKVMAEPSVRRTVYEVDANRIEGARQRNREEFPAGRKFADMKASVDATKETHQAVLNLRHAIEYLRKGEVSPISKDDLLKDVEQIKMLLEELERVVEGVEITVENIVKERT